VRPNATWTRRYALPLLLTAVLAACDRADQPPPAATIQGLETLVVQAGDASGGRAWDGVVEAVRQTTLSAQTSGRVAGVLRDVNDRVAANEVLVRLTTVEQQAGVEVAQAQLHAAQAAAVEAESNYQRHLQLEGLAVSKMLVDQLRMARDSAFAARDAARAQLSNARQQAAYTEIRAPYAGIVSRREVEPGQSVGIGQLLMAVFSPDALRIEVSVPQSDAERIRTEPAARITFSDGRMVEADSVTVFPSADPATHSVRVRVQWPALAPLPPPGTTAKVAFAAVVGTAHPHIPASTLVRRGELSAVYVVNDGRIALRQLRLGKRSDGQVEVIAGLAPGESIAADPLAALQALVAARKGGG